MEVVKNLQVTVPFIELLQQVPSYSKFMKDVLKRKGSLSDQETIALTEHCSAILQNTSPPKQPDPGSFSIPCTIGTLVVENALCDLGASVSVIPFSLCEKLNMGDLKATNITLKMADRSIKRPMGVLENVPVKVGKHFIPVDFVVMEMDEDSQMPIILGRPFLNTVGAVIDLRQGILTLSIGEETVTFHLPTTKHNPMIEETAFAINVVNDAMIGLDSCAGDSMLFYTGSHLKETEKGDEGSAAAGLEEQPTIGGAVRRSVGALDAVVLGEIGREEVFSAYIAAVEPEHTPLPSNLNDHEIDLVIVSDSSHYEQLKVLCDVLNCDYGDPREIGVVEVVYSDPSSSLNT